MPPHIRGTLPLPVRRILRKLGSDIRDVRLRRRIRASTMAERARRSNTTRRGRTTPCASRWIPR